jgi:hypothetical protein
LGKPKLCRPRIDPLPGSPPACHAEIHTDQFGAPATLGGSNAFPLRKGGALAGRNLQEVGGLSPSLRGTSEKGLTGVR